MLECRLIHTLEFELNSLFVGEVADVKADPAVLGPDGLPEMAKVAPIVYDLVHFGYYGVGESLGAYGIGKALRDEVPAKA